MITTETASSIDALRDFFYELDAAERKEFAKQCETTVGTIIGLINGARAVQPHTAMLMEIASCGKLRAETLSPKAPWARWLAFRAASQTMAA